MSLSVFPLFFFSFWSQFPLWINFNQINSFFTPHSTFVFMFERISHAFPTLHYAQHTPKCITCMLTNSKIHEWQIYWSLGVFPSSIKRENDLVSSLSFSRSQNGHGSAEPSNWIEGGILQEANWSWADYWPCHLQAYC